MQELVNLPWRRSAPVLLVLCVAATASLAWMMVFMGSADLYLEVPQIIWGLNNQKIALARAALTARFLNRALLMPTLSATVFHNASHPAQAVAFDQVFSLAQFNARCKGFVRIARRSELPASEVEQIYLKGSGRRWTEARDLVQLEECKQDRQHRFIKIAGKNPFLWPDHWQIGDYVKIFSCLALHDSIMEDVHRVVAKLEQAQATRAKAEQQQQQQQQAEQQHQQQQLQRGDYVAVHMRIEQDWMIHCKHSEERALQKQGKRLRICASKDDIIRRVSRIPGLRKPATVYLAVADELLEDAALLQGWGSGLVAYEKKRLGVLHIYSKHSYLVQSAMDYEVCLRSAVFAGNSFSTFSSLVVLDRTLRAAPAAAACDISFAYNLEAPDGGPQPWAANLSKSRVSEISYDSDVVHCSVPVNSNHL